jgi:hAT family C-terminal dimerisation region
LFNSKGSSVSSIVSDTRAGLKDFIRVKKISESIKSEIDDYLADAFDEASLDDDFDILAWWKLKGIKYPVLARLTRDILAVPIFTVASESTFSTSGRILNPVRNSLSNESIEALVCDQDWLRASVTG